MLPDIPKNIRECPKINCTFISLLFAIFQPENICILRYARISRLRAAKNIFNKYVRFAAGQSIRNHHYLKKSLFITLSNHTKMKRKILIITGILFGILFWSRATLTVNMGSAELQGGGYYTFPNATVTGDATDRGYVIRFMFTRTVSSGDVITLPALPAGLPGNWAVQTAISTQYVRVIAAPNSASGANAAQMQTFLRQIQVKFDTGKQGHGVTVLISDNISDAGRSIFYSSDTEHYYEYVAYSGIQWIDAYNTAMSTRFMGLKGYLATITSEEEQNLLASIAGNNQGWIGGTRAKLNFNSDSTVASLASTVGTDNYWYWVAGPEFNDNGRDPTKSVFYRRLTHSSAENTSVSLTYPYTNWSSSEPNNSGPEYVVHLLPGGKWNDFFNHNTSCNGYLVEYYKGELQGPSSSSTVGFNCNKTASVGGAPDNAGTSANPVTVYYGDVITYKIHASNASEDHTEVTVTDVVPEGITVNESSISNSGSYNSATRTVTWILSLPVNGGNTDISFNVTPSLALPEDAATLPVNNSVTVTCNNKGNMMSINTNSTYHEIRRAKVTFAVDEPDAADLTVSHNPWTVDYGRTPGAASVDANATTKPGYVFHSWSYPAYTDLKNVPQSGGSNASYTGFTVYGHMTVTANFDTIPYHINYTLNGGTNHAANPSEYHVKTETVTLQPPARAGYHFDGWKNTSGTTVTAIPKGSTADTTLVAYWTEITAHPIKSDTLCNGATIPAITFTSGLSYVGSYDWTVGNPALLGLSNASGTIPAGSALTFGPTINATAYGQTDTVTVTPKEGANSGTPMKFGITVNPTPRVNPTPSDTTCNGGTTAKITFSSPATGATNIIYKWENLNRLTGFPNNGNGDINPETLTNSGNTFLQDSIVVTPYFEGFESCPGPTDTFLVTVNPVPQVTPTPNDTVCNGETKTVTFSSPTAGATPVVYTWMHRIDGGGTVTGEGNLSFIAGNTGNNVLTDSIIVTPRIGSCDGVKDTFLVFINPTPRVTALTTPGDTVCNGVDVNISFNTTTAGTTGIVYEWEHKIKDSGTSSTGMGNLSFTAVNGSSTAVTDSIIVTPYFDGFKSCSGPKATIPVVVNPTARVTPMPNDTVCNGTAVTQIDFTTPVTGATVTYTWESAGDQIGLVASGTGHIPAFTAVNSGNTPLTDSIVVTPHINGCPGVKDTFLIVVNPMPQVNTLSDTTVCNSTMVMNIDFSTPVSGTTPTITYTWTKTGPDIGLVTSGTGNIPTFTAVNNGNTSLTDTVVVTPYIGNCSGPAKTFHITVNPAPKVNPTPNDTVCNSTTVATKTFGTTVTGATVNYNWTATNHALLGLSAATGTGSSITFTGPAVNTGLSPRTDTVTVTPYIDGFGGCPGQADTFLVVVNPAPQVNQISDTTIFNDSTVTQIDFTTQITGTTPAVSYSWTRTGPDIGLAATSGADNIPAFTAVNTGNTPLTNSIAVTPHVGGCDGPVKTFNITVNPAPKVTPMPNDTVCNGAAVNLSFTSPITGATPPVTYTWTHRAADPASSAPPSGSGNSLAFTAVNSSNAPLTDSVVVTPHIGSVEGLKDTILIVVNPTATVYAIGDTVYYDGQTVTSLTAVSPTTPASDVTFGWTNSHTSIGLAASGTGATIPGFTASHPSATGSTIATITVTPKYKNCTGTQETFTVTVKPRPTISYNYDGGTPPSSPNPTNYVAGTGCTVSGEPSKPGYMFQGWTCVELGIATPTKPLVVPTTATASLTLKAEWGNAIPYTITYHLDGGTNAASNPLSYNINSAFTLAGPTKAGHTFTGWTGTDIAGPFPQLGVTVPAGTAGDREYTAHWSFQFAADTVYGCMSPVTLQSGHDGQSCEWTLPDGSTQTAADIQAAVTGRYILATNYGANSIITKDTVLVVFAFDDATGVVRISTAGTKIHLPQVFTVTLNPEIIAAADNIAWEWSFPGGNPSTPTNVDTVTAVYAGTGQKTVSVRIGITRGAQFCEKRYTYDFEIYSSIRGLFVDRNVAGGTEDGSSWQNAFRTIQEALVNVSEGDYVWVARGDYRPDDGKPFVLTRDSVEIYGGFAATETYLYERDFTANPTILHGNGNSVIYTERVSDASRWDGFTVEDGNAALGGGIRNRNSSVTVANSIIRGNGADSGGGIFSEGGAPVLYNVEISGNTAIDGGGMYSVQSSPALINVTVGGNRASAAGGGLYNSSGSNPVLHNTIVWGNRSAAATGIHNSSAVPQLASSLVEGSRTDGVWNAATGVDGGGNLDASPEFRARGFDNSGHMQQGNYQLFSSSPAIDRGNNRWVFYVPMRWNVNLQEPQDSETASAITGKDLAGNVRMENATVDMGAYEYSRATDSITIIREVTIPEVRGMTTVPPAGRHYVQSYSDFVFSIIPLPGYSLDHLDVKTGIPSRDREGIRLERNDDGSVTAVLLKVNETLKLTIDGVTPMANMNADGSRVWSYGNHLYVRTDRDTEVQIRTPAGMLYKRQQIGVGDTAVMLPQGFYIVMLDGKTYRVIIR
jgi:uncharacterized repeat protein (TIGR02543 family)/uncharacterized repeat protein (TIGR01451 family)